MYSVNMKLWDCNCGTGKNCGSCPYGTYHYCTNCKKSKPGHLLENCPEKKRKVHFSNTSLYIVLSKNKEHYPSTISKKSLYLGLEPKNKNGFVFIFNKSSDNNWYILLQKRSPNVFMPNHIGVPGGRKKENETDLDVVIRETYQDVGYLLDISQLLKFTENDNCSWYMTTEYIHKYKLVGKQTIEELGDAPQFKTPPKLCDAPYGHFWIKLSESAEYLQSQERMIGLEQKIYQACKYI